MPLNCLSSYAPSGDQYISKVAALLHFEGANGATATTDQLGKSTVSMTGFSLTTSSPLYGTSSASASGAGNQQILVSPQSTIGTQDFTIELSMSFATMSGGQMVFDTRPSAQGAFPTIYWTGSAFSLYLATGDRIVGGTTTAGTRTAVCLQRQSGVLTLFINGTSVGQFSDVSSYDGNWIALGANTYNNALPLSAGSKIDEFRFTIGQARYSGNYTPLTTVFPDK